MIQAVTQATIRTDAVIFRDDLYPRIETDPALVQKYAADLSVLPPIEVNQHNELIDGWHRWTAHKKTKAEEISVTVTQTATEVEFLALAIRRNATHGKQMTDRDKAAMARRLYSSGQGIGKDDIAETLSVSLRSVNSYLSDVDKQMRSDRKKRIFDMWLACYGLEEIGEAVELDKAAISRELEVCCDLEALPKVNKVAAQHADDFETPIYNVWSWSKKTNAVSHFGNSEQRILDNLLYLYTEPFDIVVDPFAGGGSTIDVCKKRLRRYYVSDRAPIVEREHEIRKLDVCESLPPLNKRWSEVRLTYLDPPYWRQAQGKYSDDAADLANMPLEDFTAQMVATIKGVAKKQSRGAVAMLMQPTQWNADDRQWTDHIIDIVASVKPKNLVLENRVSCPYSTEQCLPQMVDWAKENRKLLCLSRELVIWRFV